MWMCEPYFMFVCLIQWLSECSLPTGQPCAVWLCCNRFWQLCNFCLFHTDLGKVSFCAMQVSFFSVFNAHNHAREQNQEHGNKMFLKDQKYLWMHTNTHTHTPAHIRTSSTHMRVHTSFVGQFTVQEPSNIAL